MSAQSSEGIVNQGDSYASKNKSNNARDLGPFESYCKRHKTGIAFSLALALLSLIVLVTLLVIQRQYFYKRNFAVVFDAGTTGTRGYLYEWQDKRLSTNHIVKEVNSCKTTALTKLNLSNDSNGLLNCASMLLKSVPSSYTQKLTLFLAATAGMRIFTLENPSESKNRFELVAASLRKMGFNVLFSDIITGEEEGATAWIAANILSELLSPENEKKTKTIGTLEMGGGSTQLVFESLSGNYGMELFKQKHTLYDVSYLCYGTKKFMDIYIASVMALTKETEFSCLLSNSKVQISIKPNYCSGRWLQDHNFPAITNKTTNKVAKGNGAKCRAQLKTAIGNDIKKPNDFSNMQFLALSAFFYYNSFLVKSFAYDGTYSGFVKATDLFCSEDFNKLNEKYAPFSKYAKDYCFQGNFMIVLFQKFGFTGTAFKKLQFVNKVKGGQVTWNMGYMVWQTINTLPSFLYRIPLPAFGFLVALLLVAIAACVIFLCFLMWQYRLETVKQNQSQHNQQQKPQQLQEQQKVSPGTNDSHISSNTFQSTFLTV